MSDRPRFNLVDIVARDYDATLAFYLRLCADVDDGPPGEIRHAHIHFDGVEIHLDNEHLAGLFNSSWRAGQQARGPNSRTPSQSGRGGDADRPSRQIDGSGRVTNRRALPIDVIAARAPEPLSSVLWLWGGRSVLSWPVRTTGEPELL
jgi:hypothetical protein